MPTFTLTQLADQLGCQLIGDGSRVISGVATIDNAGPEHLTFLANSKYAAKVKSTAAGGILAGEPQLSTSAATLVSSNPYYDFARALGFFYQPPRPSPSIHPTAVIAPTATIGPDAFVGPYSVIGDRVTIGSRATIHPHVVIYEGCQIGDDFTAHSHASVREFTLIGHRVTIHNGVVLGGDGFGFAKRGDGSHFKIAQAGRTVIEDDVEIQTLTSVDRATMGETRVKRGAKLDSLVQIGHACIVGEDNIICAQTGLAGSTVLEENVVMAGQTGSSGHLTVGKNSIVYGQTGLPGDVPPNSTVGGSPGYDGKLWLRTSAALPKLPDLLRSVRSLERRLAALERDSHG